VILLAWTKIRSGKTAMHLSARNFRAISDAEDAALLTQGKDNKAESAEKSRRQAMWVQLPPPLGDLSQMNAYINRLVAGGMSLEEAQRQAKNQFFIGLMCVAPGNSITSGNT
jgi:hypothetical protein